MWKVRWKPQMQSTIAWAINMPTKIFKQRPNAFLFRLFHSLTRANPPFVCECMNRHESCANRLLIFFTLLVVLFFFIHLFIVYFGDFGRNFRWKYTLNYPNLVWDTITRRNAIPKKKFIVIFFFFVALSILLIFVIYNRYFFGLVWFSCVVVDSLVLDSLCLSLFNALFPWVQIPYKMKATMKKKPKNCIIVVVFLFGGFSFISFLLFISLVRCAAGSASQLLFFKLCLKQRTNGRKKNTFLRTHIGNWWVRSLQRKNGNNIREFLCNIH